MSQTLYSYQQSAESTFVTSVFNRKIDRKVDEGITLQ